MGPAVYLSTIDRKPERGPLRIGFTRVGGTVVALGSVSLLTDVSAEMVTAVLPLYFVLVLHLSPAAYGVVDGLYSGATVPLRLVGGFLADRLRRRKAVAATGYGLSAVAKLGLIGAGTSVTGLGAVIVADRAGKGLRTAPRDALITESTPEPLLGRAFGIHRAMDSAGAFAGPLVALGILTLVGTTSQAAFHSLFLTSFWIAVAGVLALVVFTRESVRPRDVKPGRALEVTPRAAAGLLRDRSLRRLLYAAGLLGLSTVGDGFVYLILMRRQDFAAGWFPLFAVGTNLAYLLLAGPLGALADRVGRKAMLLTGYGLLAAVYLLLITPFRGLPAACVILGLYGTFYAATDGVLMALAGPVLPRHLRTTGLACVQTVQAVAYLASSIAFGLAWANWGVSRAGAAAAVAVAVTIIVTVVVLPGRAQQPGDAR
ncbi:MFS transporter [Actinomadura barringtoniae]|uniref:MFS transporter n=1 Tax=Actinomadura barringtoniae TaxID=1427535 RepID=A0A939PLI2_9ACTN|nr:MFS transporter [Actinomadura barringtoniae]MBO2454520.1 MFS transporter [Actinomadura barringtoniae]